MHLHLDPVGGIAGDMFVAAMLDGFPELETGMLGAIRALPGLAGLDCRSVPHDDGVLVGRRFLVGGTAAGHVLAPPEGSAETGAHAHDRGHAAAHGHPHAAGAATHAHAVARVPHGHVRWADVRRDLEGSALEPATRRHALGIFALLAEAEGRVHGVAADDVSFHEVGAADSLADIVAAAHLIAHCGAARWSVSALPLGSGRVRTAHGMLPVPAPATALLLEGFAVFDDGLPGERVTPTGAAILRHLVRSGAADPAPRRMGRSGFGFGTKVFPGLSNCLRVLALDDLPTIHPAPRPGAADEGGPDPAAPRPEASPPPGPTPGVPHREIAVVEFEVDDQTAEDLAAGLDRLRDASGVHDVVQMPVFGKKGRLMTHVRVLAAPHALEEAMAACFRETTTIGLRHRLVSGAALPRRMEEVSVDGAILRVKLVERPGAGRTAKADIGDLPPGLEGSQARRDLRARAEAEALARPAGEAR